MIVYILLGFVVALLVLCVVLAREVLMLIRNYDIVQRDRLRK